jgi:hypothetical protein
VLELIRYGEQWMPSPLAPPMRLRHLDCGHITRAGQHCSECGQALTLKNLRIEPNQAATGAG